MASPTEPYAQPHIETSNLVERLEHLSDHHNQENLSTLKSNFIERWQSTPGRTRDSRDSVTSWLTSQVKRRPLASLFAGAVVISSWIPLLLFIVFAACVFTIVFFSFIVFESCLIGAGLVILLLCLTIPLCFSLSLFLGLFLLHWVFTVLREHVQELVEYFTALVIFYGTLYAPKTIRRMIGL